MAKKTRYLIYRYGSNNENQPGRDCAPVAIVEATSRAEAEKCDSPDRPTIDDCAWLVLNASFSEVDWFAVAQSFLDD